MDEALAAWAAALVSLIAAGVATWQARRTIQLSDRSAKAAERSASAAENANELAAKAAEAARKSNELGAKTFQESRRQFELAQERARQQFDRTQARADRDETARAQWQFRWTPDYKRLALLNSCNVMLYDVQVKHLSGPGRLLTLGRMNAPLDMAPGDRIFFSLQRKPPKESSDDTSPYDDDDDGMIEVSWRPQQDTPDDRRGVWRCPVPDMGDHFRTGMGLF